MTRTEVIERRSANAKHFDNGDGTFTAEVTVHAQHYIKGGAWTDIDCALYGGNTELIDADTGEKYTHSTKDHPLTVRINKFKQGVTVKQGEKHVTLKPVGANQVTGVKYENRVTFAQGWDGVDVTFTVTPEGVGIRYEVSAPTTVAWDVTDAHGLLKDALVPEGASATYMAGRLTYTFATEGVYE